MAYFDRKGIWTINVDGSGRKRIVRLGEPTAGELAWSPRGSWIAFTDTPYTVGTSRPTSAFVVRARGGHPRRLARALFIGGLSWSPDERRLALTTQKRPNGPAVGLIVTLTGGRQRLPARGGGATFSPDGGWLLFSRYPFLYVSRADGTGERRIARGNFAVWSPDSQRLAYVGPPGGIAVVGRSGKGRRVLVRDAEEVKHLEWR